MEICKPCPFCGAASQDSFALSSWHRKWGWVECVACGATGPDVHTRYEDDDGWRDAAVAEWNRRKLSEENS